MNKLKDLSILKKIYLIFLLLLILISLGFIVNEIGRINNLKTNISCGPFSQEFNILDREGIEEFSANYCYVPKINYEINLSLYLKNES